MEEERRIEKERERTRERRKVWEGEREREKGGKGEAGWKNCWKCIQNPDQDAPEY